MIIVNLIVIFGVCCLVGGLTTIWLTGHNQRQEEKVVYRRNTMGANSNQREAGKSRDDL
ncbi:MAG TPA: hypothetical protein VH186_32080 [Chloroflexia bacterium]|nr:hypothetical protein [Chloroflexia bacterium]